MKRRAFLGNMAAGLMSGAAIAAQTKNWRSAPRTKAVETRNTARNLIFVLLEGGPSHVDTFDIKTGPWTPDLLGVQDLGSGFLWPSGLMPKLAGMTDKFSIIRSLSAVEAVHERAVYQLITAHRQNNALIDEIPHFASVLSYELAAQRRPNDSLPTVMKVGDFVGQGFFGSEHKGLILSEFGGVENLQHYYAEGEPRLSLLDQMLALAPNHGDARSEHLNFQTQAREMMNDTELHELLGINEEEPEFDDSSSTMFLRQCQTCVRAIAADKGTRVFQMTLGGWDHHFNIFNTNDPGALPGLGAALDDGLAYLITELESRQGVNGGTLLDETLIVAVGEFGRTVGALNSSAGRDHWPDVVPAFLAGGGVKGGRIIGSTSNNGGFITDPGWSQSRFMNVGDLNATIYSALGVDWTKRFLDTPSGRLFEVVDSSLTGAAYDIENLFV